MIKLADRVQETTTTTGTGTITLAGAKTGYRSFSSAFSSGDTVYYCITDGTDWEVGSGVFTTSGTTLTRASILASSNSGSAVSFGAGSKDVFCTSPASLLDDKGSLSAANSWLAQQTFKEVKDTVYTITDGAGFEIDPANGSIQVVTLGASRTPAATNFESGQIVILGIDDGTAYAVTWSTVGVTWVKPGGTASAPTLAASGYTWVLLWKVGSTIYGAEVGKP